jgi:hypothetical protein
MLAEDVGGSIPGERRASCIPEDGALAGGITTQQGSYRDGRLSPEGTEPILTPLPVEAHLKRALELDVLSPDGERFADTGTCVVEDKEESAVANTSGSCAFRLPQQDTRLLWLEIAGWTTLRAFGGHCEDLSILLRVAWIVAQDMLDEAVDGCEPAISRTSAVASHPLEMVQERQHHVRAQVLHVQFTDGSAPLFGDEDEEEPQPVAARRNKARSWIGARVL